jgi:hypothetical protein
MRMISGWTWALVGLCASGGLGCGGGDKGSEEGNSALSPSGGSSGSPSSSSTGSSANKFGEADCVAPPNATATWKGEVEFGTSCLVVCNPGFADCDGRRDNGCETDTSDAAACGRCVDSCLTDLCGAASTCNGYTADVWTLQADIGGGRLRDLAVNGEGQVFARLNTPPLKAPAPLPAVTAGAVLGAGASGPLWQSAGTDTSFPFTQTDATLHTDSRVVGSSAGLYVAEYFDSADIGGQHYESTSGRDVLLSLVSYTGTHVWSRAFNMTGSPSVFGLFADEAGNAYVHVYTDEDFTFEGHAVDVPSSGGYAVLSFTPAGDFRWVQSGLDPADVQPASGPYFAEAGAIFEGSLRSSETGERARSLGAESSGAKMISANADGSLLIAGTATSSDLQQHSGLPGFSGVSADGQIGKNQNTVFVQKLDASGALVWETHFGSLFNLTLYGLRVASDGTSYVLATGNHGPAGIQAPGNYHIFVARVGADGHQEGAFSFDADSPRKAALELDAEGKLHIGAHFTNGATLDKAVTGAGLVGIDLSFTAL